MKIVLADQQVISFEDLKVLDDVRRLFYETTNLGLSFYYTGSNSYDFYPPNEKNSYCRLIQSFLGVEPCINCDLEALQRATRSGDYCIYTCHAGLLNIAVPLSFNGEVLGAMFTGQLVKDLHSHENFDRMVEKMPLKAKQKQILYTRYLQVKRFDKDQLVLATKLIVFMSNYIISRENEIFLQSEIFKKEEQILQFENEQMRMRNNLQKLSIRVLKDQVDQQSDVTKLPYKPNRKVSVVRRAEELIQQYFANPLTLENVAGAIYLSPNYFSTIFKEITNTTFTNYLNEVRINEGKRLLKETDMPIKGIVPQVGFSDYNYFNKVFKKIAGLPPATFREMQGTNLNCP